MNKTDVIVSGAGMVGAITALTLAKSGRSVSLIDQAEASQFNATTPLQLRVSAVSQRNLALLSELGVIDHMQQQRLGHYQHMSVWDNRSTGALDFNHSTELSLGAIIENQHITAATQSALRESPLVQTYFGSQIKQWESTPRKVKVELTDGSAMEAGLLLVAEGANSFIRTKAGIPTHLKDYKQKGLVCHIRMNDAPESTALQAFNATGPVGLLPLNEGLFSVVWTLPNDQVDYWLKVDEEKFINGLQAHINRSFGQIDLISKRAAFPLQQMNAKQYYQERLVLLGDAAHTVHPLAGQGVNLGIADGQCLAGLMSEVNLRSEDEVLQALKKYQRQRKAEVFKTSEMMNVIHHLFISESAPIKMLRAFGMNRLNQINPIKQWLMSQAGS
ncbi:FAD-dependent monooxygenase [Marinicella litoralis]|uniref:2-octaprenyl-6-methoxyphenol hydroxylase /2-octaprenyl-3-methyl-6-methoxy-1,4-benzoquinol hydroxylase n=1 Tax=Marinicella litoralis TaxID=644220 RepID=A0A4R6XLB6_9GAMM|nr:FAD-dependent monooxygenase [Marinicella litoralis]TDR16838.1 2-octaprenyl-6-methoxyphenol hydroxylase /2-octaprenyl-3-methyl-6-methoxy-1,4-benzoquinol hydroxylase [Marinicella litoralis]